MLVAVFYLPAYQCTELGYFDIAKQTSGIGQAKSPDAPEGGWNGL